MLSILVFLALATAPTSDNVVMIEPPRKSCAAAYFSRLIGPHGVPSSWKENSQIPHAIGKDPGETINDAGVVADGFSHWLVPDVSDSKRAYVKQIGGLTGDARVYGPFPLPQCSSNNTEQIVQADAAKYLPL